MKESDVRAVTLFFLFAFADEAAALTSASEAVRRLRNKKLESDGEFDAAQIVAVTRDIWERNRRRARRSRAAPLISRHWSLPEGVDFGPWRDFQKNASEEELLGVIWSRILGFHESDIARGLNLTEGTVRYRLGRAFRKLGGFVVHSAGGRA